MIIGKMYHPLEGFLIAQVETGIKITVQSGPGRHG